MNEYFSRDTTSHHSNKSSKGCTRGNSLSYRIFPESVRNDECYSSVLKIEISGENVDDDDVYISGDVNNKQDT